MGDAFGHFFGESKFKSHQAEENHSWESPISQMNTLIICPGMGKRWGNTALQLSPVLLLTEVINPSWTADQIQALGLESQQAPLAHAELTFEGNGRHVSGVVRVISFPCDQWPEMGFFKRQIKPLKMQMSL